MAGPRDLHPRVHRLIERLSRKLVAEAKERRLRTGDVEGQTFFDFGRGKEKA